MKILVKVKGKLDDKIISELGILGFKVEDILDNLNILIGETIGQSQDKLQRLGYIEDIERDEQFFTQSLNLSVQPNIKFGHLHKHNYFGNNVRIAMIDTGVNPEGLKIENSLVFTDATDSLDAGNNGRLHGTYVAHTIKKVAPWSKLFNLKVKNSENEILKSAILRAIDWCFGNNISIVNISLGRQFDCKPNCMVCNSIKKLRSNGIVTVVAVGNLGRDGEMSFGCPAKIRKCYYCWCSRSI